RIDVLLQDNILSRSKITVDYVSYARVENELKLDVGFNIKTELTSPKRVSLITDAESIAGRKILTRSGIVGIKRKVVSAPSKTTAESILRFPEDLAEPAEVLMAHITPTVESTEWVGDTLYVNGGCSLEFVYTGVDAELHSVFWDQVLDFSAPVDFSGLEVEADIIGIEVSTEFFRHQVVDNAMEVTTGLSLLAEVAAPEAITCLLEAMAIDDIVEKPAYITFVVIEEDDSLWKLAEKYQTSVETIMEDNGLLAGELVPGQKLIIRRYKA
ncbi:MAG: LysM peptidoglycan-binding domain-containing protein, partial [Bacillota bacterium]